MVLFLVITARLRPETSLIHVYVGSAHKTSNKCPIVNHRKHKRRSLNFDSAMSLKVKLNRGLIKYLSNFLGTKCANKDDEHLFADGRDFILTNKNNITEEG